jgi:DGQHR domain-containing protein
MTLAIADESESVRRENGQEETNQVTTADPVEIPVLMAPVLRGGIQLVLGVMDAGTLAERFVIPRRDHRRKTGYQREASISRVNRIVADLREKKIDLPTAILLNLRTFDRVKNLRVTTESTTLVMENEPLFVVDGQHRVEALKKLVAEEPEGWSDFEIPFVCMLGASPDQEMEQFYIVNSTAKSVRTDLALDLLKQRAESNVDVMTTLIERGQAWKVKGQTVVEELERLSTIWRGKVRFPGDASADKIIASAGMVSALKQPLSTPYFGSITTENQVKVLDAYWQGIRKILPEVFDNPSQYTIQKATGVLVLHGLLVSVLEYVRSKGWSVIEAASYAKAMKDALIELEGDTAEGEVVSGADFWRAGPTGAAGTYSSNAAKRVLIAKLRAALPAVEVE